MPLQQPTVTVKYFSVGHGGDVVWCEHARLVIPMKLCQTYCSVLSLAQDIAHTCWKAIQPTGVLILHIHGRRGSDLPQLARVNVMVHCQTLKTLAPY